jgi:hypothetical protein
MNLSTPEGIAALGAAIVTLGSIVQSELAAKEQDSFYRNQEALRGIYKEETKRFSWWKVSERHRARRRVEESLGTAFDEFRMHSKMMTRFATGWSCITVGSVFVTIGAVIAAVSR